jgi:putative flippase GtrA
VTANHHPSRIISALQVLKINSTTLLRYLISSVVTAAVDYLVFLCIYASSSNLVASIFLARAASILVNFTLLKLGVFHSRESILVTFPRYILVVIISGILAGYLMIPFLQKNLGFPIIFAKAGAEAILYMANLLVISRLVFRR